MGVNLRRGSLYRSLFWPLLLIGVGVVWLLADTGVLEPFNIRFLLRLWPIFLIAIGLDIIFGRQSPVLGGLIGLGAVVLVIALLVLAPSLDLDVGGELKTLNFSESLDDASSARIDLDLDRYQTTIDALEDSTALIEAELDTLTDVAFEARGGQEKSVTLKSVGDITSTFDWWDTAFQDARWDIGLSPEIPIDLTVDVGSGSATLNLIGLVLNDFELDGGSGSTRLTLPASGERYSVRIDGGSGFFNIELVEGADVDAVIDVGSGSFTIIIDAGVDFEADIESGSGSAVVDAPRDAAVRVMVEDSGSGSVNVPSSFSLIDDGGDEDRDTGTWESDGFASAEFRIEITFDGGSGSFTVR